MMVAKDIETTDNRIKWFKPGKEIKTLHLEILSRVITPVNDKMVCFGQDFPLLLLHFFLFTFQY